MEIELSKIFGNNKNIEFITDYIKNKKNTKAIIVRGPVGVGKMTMIKACIKKIGHQALIYDTDIENDEDFENIIMSLKAKGMNKLFGIPEKVMVIHDIDNSLKVTQKNIIYEYISKSNINTPLIMTSCDRTVGTLRSVPSCIEQLDFEISGLQIYIDHFSNNSSLPDSSLPDSLPSEELKNIIINSNYDMRYINTIINSTTSDIIYKNIELNTFESIKFCANLKNNWEDKIEQCSFYTNCTIFHNYPSMTSDITTIQKIAELSSISDTINSHIFQYGLWTSMNDMSYIIGTIGPLEIITKNKVKNKVNDKIYDKLTYPSSNITINEDHSDFNNDDSLVMRILINKYFKTTKFVGSTDEFKKDIKYIKDPIKGYKLCFMNGEYSDKKQYRSILKELKNKLKSMEPKH